MPERDWAAVFRKRDDVVTRQIVGETILVPVRGRLINMQKLFCLNPVAAFVWDHVDGQQTLAEIRDAVAAAFEVQPIQAAVDLQEFVAELLGAELIEESTRPCPAPSQSR